MIIGNRYFLDDVETGYYEVSKREYYAYKTFIEELWEQAKPQCSRYNIGTVSILGTTGGTSTDDFKMFYSNEPTSA